MVPWTGLGVDAVAVLLDAGQQRRRGCVLALGGRQGRFHVQTVIVSYFIAVVK